MIMTMEMIRVMVMHGNDNGGDVMLMMIVILPNQLYKSSYSSCLCFPSVFWLAKSLFSLLSCSVLSLVEFCLYVSRLNGRQRSSLSSRLTAVIPRIFESHHSYRKADRSPSAK